jgi:hypothetical protein
MKVELIDVILHEAVCFGDTFMLPQVLDPRLDQERFKHTAFLCRVLEDAPGVRPVAPPNLLKPSDRLEKAVTVFNTNMVLNGY